MSYKPQTVMIKKKKPKSKAERNEEKLQKALVMGRVLKDPSSGLMVSRASKLPSKSERSSAIANVKKEQEQAAKASKMFDEVFKRVKGLLSPKEIRTFGDKQELILRQFYKNKKEAGKKPNLTATERKTLESFDPAKVEKMFKDSFKLKEKVESKKAQKIATGRETLAMLKDEARKRKLKGFSTMNKPELKAALGK